MSVNLLHRPLLLRRGNSTEVRLRASIQGRHAIRMPPTPTQETPNGTVMRAFSGQHSDAVPVKRTQQQKQAQLAQLREQLAGLKPFAAASMRESIIKRIADLERELGSPAPSGRKGR